MPSFAGLGKFFGRTASEGAAFAAGLATAPTLAPVVRAIENETWQLHPDHPVSAGDAAEIVAENVEQEDWGATQAASQGINGDAFRALVGAVLNAPGFAQLLTLYRRGEIDQAGLEHGFRKARLETQWDGPLEALKDDRLDPAVIALGVVRGLIASPITLPKGPPTATGKVPAFPQFNVDAEAEAAASGIDLDRLSVLIGNTGRPAPVGEAARAAFRNIIDRVDFDRAISEGDVRNEWGDALFEVARQILTAHDWVELHLRGYVSEDEMYAGCALHGMSQADAFRLYQVSGRPLTVKQITTGLARGGTFEPLPGEITDPFEASVHEANIRPSFYSLAIANRYTLPSDFVIRALLKDGVITAAHGEQLLLQSGRPPDLAKIIADHYATATATTPATDKHVNSAQTALLTTIRRRYVDGAITEPQAAAALAKTGLADTTQTGLLATWTQERDVNALVQPPQS
jgi:hypothetical protein